MDATWTPPKGSIEIEPGWWEASNGSIYADPSIDELTDGQKQVASDKRREEAARRVRQDAALVPELIDRIQGLELQVYLTELFLAEALEMVAEGRDRIRFLDDLIAGLVLEIPGAVT